MAISPQSFAFPKSMRLRKSIQFKAVYDKRCKASDGLLLVFAAANGDDTQMGLSVSRKLGNAVVRNRLKRLLREAFRLSRSEIPRGMSLIAIPQGAARAGLVPYRQSLVRLAQKLHRRLTAVESKPAEESSA